MAKSKLLRVTQMNAVYFDKELYNVFKQHIHEFLKYLPPGIISKYECEMNLLLRLAILNYSVVNHNSTFGQKLLSIKYENMTPLKKLCFLLGAAFDYCRQRCELSWPSHRYNRYFHNVTSIVRLLQFVNISLFLRYGTKPQLIERALNLNQTYCKENVHRHYEDKYMARELLWNGFIEVLVYMLPLINYHKITRTFRHLNPLHKKPEFPSNITRSMTRETKCVHCDEFPVIPHHMGCSHIFCYVCLKSNQTADPKYECPVCEFQSERVVCDKVFVEL